MGGFDVQGFHNPMSPSELRKKQMQPIKGISAGAFFSHRLGLQEAVFQMVKKKTADYSPSAIMGIGGAFLHLKVIEKGVPEKLNFFFTVFDAKLDKGSRPHYDESISQYQYATLFAGTFLMVPGITVAVQGQELAISDRIGSLSEKIIARVEPRKGDAWFTVSLEQNPSTLIVFVGPYSHGINRVGLHVANPAVAETGKGFAIKGDLVVGIEQYKRLYDFTKGKTNKVGLFETFIQTRGRGGLENEAEEALAWISQSILAAESFGGAIADHFGRSIDSLDTLNFLRLKYEKYSKKY